MEFDNTFEVCRSQGLADLRVGDELDLEVTVRVIRHEQEQIDVSGFSNKPRPLPETLPGQEKLVLSVTSIKRPVE